MIPSAKGLEDPLKCVLGVRNIAKCEKGIITLWGQQEEKTQWAKQVQIVCMDCLAGRGCLCRLLFAGE